MRREPRTKKSPVASSRDAGRRLGCCLALALLAAPRGAGAQDFLFNPELRSPALRIAREHAELSTACGETAPSTDPSADPFSASRAAREARAVLFSADGLLDPDPRRAAADLSELKRRVHSGLARPGSSRDAELHHLVAMLSFRLGDARDSLRHAARAVLAAPSSSRYLSNLAFFLHAARRLRQATLVYEHARRIDPDNTATHLGLLALAADSAHPDLQEMKAIAQDWRRREKVPELARMANTLTEVLSELAGLRLPAQSDERGASAEEVTLLRDMLREFLDSPEEATPREDPAAQGRPDAERRTRKAEPPRQEE